MTTTTPTRGNPRSPTLFDSADDVVLDASESWLRAIAAAPPVLTELTPGTIVDDSYRVESLLGRGAMGAVYLASDLQLDRKVALKLHRGAASDQRVARFRQEARAMARLSHPNVLTIHEVGTHDHHLYIAMAYAPGGTLRDWMAKRPGWQEVVSVFVGVARGVAAAHQVGIVHRDLKPDNVLLTEDGRPQVADFGLARSREDPSFESESTLTPASGASLTVTGAVLGTPAYMSPEQFRSDDVGPASDQFSLCVMLFEALFGRRPYQAVDVFALSESVCSGTGMWTPPPRSVPKRLIKAVVRGLAPSPDDRHCSVTELTAELEVMGRLRGRRWALASVAVAGVSLGAGSAGAKLFEAPPCEMAGDMDGAWSAPTRRAVEERAPELFAVLDDYARAWSSAREDACVDARVEARSSEYEFGLRAACLDRHAARFSGLVRQLGRDEGAHSPSAEAFAVELAPLEACEDIEALGELDRRLARNPERRSRAEDEAWTRASELLGAARGAVLMGQDDGEAWAAQAHALAKEHNLGPVRVEAAMLQGDYAAARGRFERGRRYYDEALEFALSFGDASSATRLIAARANDAADRGALDEARLHLRYARMLLSGIRRPNAARVAHTIVELVHASVELDAGNFIEALDVLDRLEERIDSRFELRLYQLRGRVHHGLGAWEDAVRDREKVLALVESRDQRGSETAAALNNLGNTLLELGREAEATQAFTRGLERAEQAELGYLAAILRSNLGLLARRDGRLDDARDLQARSLEERRTVYGDEHPSLAYALDELGEVERLAGNEGRAREHLERALRLREETLGPEHPDVAETLTRLGRLELDLGATDRAKSWLVRALVLRERSPTQGVELAETSCLLARAVEAHAPERAQELTSSARTLLDDAPRGWDRLSSEARRACQR